MRSNQCSLGPFMLGILAMGIFMGFNIIPSIAAKWYKMEGGFGHHWGWPFTYFTSRVEGKSFITQDGKEQFYPTSEGKYSVVGIVGNLFCAIIVGLFVMLFASKVIMHFEDPKDMNPVRPPGSSECGGPPACE